MMFSLLIIAMFSITVLLLVQVLRVTITYIIIYLTHAKPWRSR